MSIFDGPTHIVNIGTMKRYGSGVPHIEAVAWFRNHIYYHKNAVIDADNLSFTLERDPGKNIEICNGIRHEIDSQMPSSGCAVYGDRRTTLATTRRNELLFRYRHEDMTLSAYPFPTLYFNLSPRFLEIMRRLGDLLDHVLEPGTADQIDLTALQLHAEACTCAETDFVGNEKTNPLIRKIADRIMLHPEEDFDIESMAAGIGMSRAGFYRKWAEYSPQPPYRLLLENRLKTAKWLLNSTMLTIKEIAVRSGFHSLPVFIETFRKHTGTAPGIWRKENRN